MNDEINSFISAYRDTLDRQRDLGMQNLENNRRNQFQNIMGAANKVGMLYSNFPERAKIQYDTGTYMPARVKTQTTYQTGLDKLRSNTTNYINQLADINDAIAHLNSLNKSSTPRGGITLNDAGDYAYQDLTGGSQFRNASGNAVRFGTTLKNAGIESTDAQSILGNAKKYLNEDEYNRLYKIWELQQNTTHPNFYYNVGKDFAKNEASYLSDEDRLFLDRLGLAFN